MKGEKNWFVNVAISLDGKISEIGKHVNLSSEEDWYIVQKFRNDIAAIVVGSNTILIDNPFLLTRSEFLPEINDISHPIRVVLDRRGRCKPESNIFKNQDISPTIWVTQSEFEIEGIYKINKVEIQEVIQEINQFLEKNNRKGDVMVEGGSQIITNFLNSGNINKIRLYRSPVLIPDGLPLFSGPITRELILSSVKKLGPGIEEIYEIH